MNQCKYRLDPFFKYEKLRLRMPLESWISFSQLLPLSLRNA